MTNRPIIFSGPMVKALLAGRKTQTRRLLSPSNTFRDGSGWNRAAPFDAHDFDGAWVDPGPSPAGNPGPCLKVPYPAYDTVHRVYSRIWIGDRLYVREAWAPLSALTHSDPGTAALIANGFYRADESTTEGEIERWRPSIHMPRWASRITLTVTDIRFQRLNDITDEDAIAEGIDRRNVDTTDGPKDLWFGVWMAGTEHPRLAYADLWNSLHNPRGLCAEDEPAGWEANPWVIATTFTVEQRNIDGRPA